MKAARGEATVARVGSAPPLRGALAAAALVAALPTLTAGAQESARKGLGIWTRNLSHSERAVWSDSAPPGVVVTHVAAGSPADAAGVRAGQRILAVDGRAVANDETLGALLRARPAEGEVHIELDEGGVGRTVRVRPVERLSFLRPACDGGDGVACWDIVIFYGWRVAPPPGASGPAAAEDHACDLGCPRACARVGLRLASRPADLERALRILRQSCADGNGDACRILGDAYVRGSWGLAIDRRQAVRFYRKGCDAGTEPSSTNACLQAAEHLVPEDASASELEAGRAIFEEACLRGRAHACHRLGRLWRDGKGGPRDAGRALALFQKACDADVAEGCLDLSDVARRASAEEARLGLSLLNTECEAFGGGACPHRGYTVGGPQTPWDVEKVLCDPRLRPRITRHPVLCRDTGFLREPGTEKELRGEAALAAALDACSRGNLIGCSYAGELLAAGDDVPADLAQALALLRRACEGGEHTACIRLELLDSATCSR